MHKYQLFGVLFFALLSTAIQASDALAENQSSVLMLIALNTPKERGVSIPMHAACNSLILKKRIQGLQFNQVGESIPLSVGFYRSCELELLSTVLTTLHKKQPRKEAIKALGDLMHYGNVVTLAALADSGTFDIPELREALCKGLGSMLSINLETRRNKCLLVKQSLERIKKEYRKKAASDACYKVRQLACTGLLSLCTIIDNAQAKAKQHYLESDGAQRDPFFSGVSYADLAHHDLVEMQEVTYGFEKYLVLATKRKCKLSDITSLDGFKYACTRYMGRQIWIYGTSVERLPKGCFKGASLSSRFILDKNKIKEIDVNAFELCDRLTTLDISRNQIEQLPAGFLKSCKRLVYLNLSCNAIVAIATDTFKNKTLRHLVLANNRLNHVDASMVAGCPRLSVLNLSDNPIPLATIKAFRGARTDLNIVFKCPKT